MGLHDMLDKTTEKEEIIFTTPRGNSSPRCSFCYKNIQGALIILFKLEDGRRMDPVFYHPVCYKEVVKKNGSKKN